MLVRCSCLIFRLNTLLRQFHALDSRAGTHRFHAALAMVMLCNVTVGGWSFNLLMSDSINGHKQIQYKEPFKALEGALKLLMVVVSTTLYSYSSLNLALQSMIFCTLLVAWLAIYPGSSLETVNCIKEGIYASVTCVTLCSAISIQGRYTNTPGAANIAYYLLLITWTLSCVVTAVRVVNVLRADPEV